MEKITPKRPSVTFSREVDSDVPGPALLVSLAYLKSSEKLTVIVMKAKNLKPISKNKKPGERNSLPYRRSFGSSSNLSSVVGEERLCDEPKECLRGKLRIMKYSLFLLLSQNCSQLDNHYGQLIAEAPTTTSLLLSKNSQENT